MNDLNIFVPFNVSKANDEERIVEGVASSEALDSQGEVIKFEAIKKALPRYLGDYSHENGRFTFGNIREMHQPSAVGKTIRATLDEVGKRLIITAKVIDDGAWKKVKEGVYAGFSIGGAAIQRIGNQISELSLSEISLVDRPANPDALFSMVKFDNSELNKKDYTAEQRKEMASSGEAMDDGSYPIANIADLKNAIQAFGRAKDPEATKAHIIRRAKALGASDLIPEEWKSKKMDIGEGESEGEMGGETEDGGETECATCGAEDGINMKEADRIYSENRDIYNADSFIDMLEELMMMAMNMAYQGKDTMAIEEAISKLKQLAIDSLSTNQVEMDKFIAGFDVLKAKKQTKPKKGCITKASWYDGYMETLRKVM